MRVNKKTILMVSLDVIQSLASLGLVYILFAGKYFPQDGQSQILISISLAVATPAGYAVAGLYRKLWRHAELNDGIYLIFGVIACQTLWFLSYRLIAGQTLPIPIWVTLSLIQFVFAIITRGSIRLAYDRLRGDNGKGSNKRTKVVIVGAGSAGALVVREIRHALAKQYQPVCFVDDDPGKQYCSISGVPVLGVLEDLPRLIEQYKIDEIIIAIPSHEQQIIQRVAKINLNSSIKLKVIPGIDSLIDGTVDVKRFRDVEVEDLLGREPIKLDLAEIAAYLKGKRVLVTGAGGSIGSELCRQIASFDPELLILLGRGENSIYEIGLEMQELFPHLHIQKVIADIKDKPLMDRLFMNYRPHVVFHAAAHKHVPLMEDWPEEAFKNNIIGTRNVALAAHENNCERFVLISTDKAIKPSSVMGATKRVAEMVVRTLSDFGTTKFVTVRFGNVLGSRGSVVPLFKRQIMRGGPITITHPDMQRYFMTIPEAVQLVIQAAAMGNGGEVFVLDMGEPVYIQELAENLIRLSGLIPGKDIEIVYSGVRPGEKLFEELFSVEEGDVATRHERIFAAAMPNGIRKDLLLQIGKYEEQLRNGQQLNIPSILQNLITDAELSSAEAQVAATSEVGVRLSGGQISG